MNCYFLFFKFSILCLAFINAFYIYARMPALEHSRPQRYTFFSKCANKIANLGDFLVYGGECKV